MSDTPFNKDFTMCIDKLYYISITSSLLGDLNYDLYLNQRNALKSVCDILYLCSLIKKTALPSLADPISVVKNLLLESLPSFWIMLSQ